MNAPLRVLQLATCGPLYGAERWILALIRSLDPALVESHVAVIIDQPEAEAPLLAAARALGAKVHAVMAPGRLSLAAPAALRRIVADEGIAVIHSHGYKPDLVTLLAARGSEVRTLATPHGWSRDAGLKLAAYEALDRLLLTRFDAVAPLSPDLADGLRPLPGMARRLHLIPNGVDLTEIDAAGDPPPELAALRRKGPLIGYAGQLITRKNLATLLSAFAAWPRGDASLVLVGAGDARAALEEQARRLGIAERTHFAGFRADRLEWMKGFDLFVLPSRLEGIPRCLMEAMALRLPVLASDIPGTRELVREGETGRLFPVGGATALSAAFDRALAEGAALGTQARALVEERFSGAAMARAYEALFARLAA